MSQRSQNTANNLRDGRGGPYQNGSKYTRPSVQIIRGVITAGSQEAGYSAREVLSDGSLGQTWTKIFDAASLSEGDTVFLLFRDSSATPEFLSGGAGGGGGNTVYSTALTGFLGYLS